MKFWTDGSSCSNAPTPACRSMSGRGAALGSEREVAPLRRLEVEHDDTGHLELGRTVVGLGVLGRAGDELGLALQVGGKTEERPLH